jgi:hypothetical protein
VLAVAGCSWGGPDELNRQRVAELGDLPGAEHSANSALRDELARIREEGRLPAQLTRDPLPEDKNAAAVIEQLFPPKELAELTARIDARFPEGKFTFSPLALEEAIRLRESCQPQLAQLAEALKRPECRFSIDYRRGFFIDRAFIAACRACAGLEAFRAAELLAAGRVAEAIRPLRAMFELARHLGAVKLVEARLEAAELRSRAFRVMQAVMDHPRVTRAEVAVCRKLVHEQLAHWPYDGDAWIGDRAQAMHAYELVRRGEVLLLLTDIERVRFAAEDDLTDFARAARRLADEDELYYLQTMRDLIEACRKPYYTRRAKFAALRSEREAMRDQPHFPLVAARLFLPNIEGGQQVQARDRALTECWDLALTLALGESRPAEQVDPVRGKPYHVSLDAARAKVWSDGRPARPAVAPILAP